MPLFMPFMDFVLAWKQDFAPKAIKEIQGSMFYIKYAMRSAVQMPVFAYVTTTYKPT